MLEQLKKLKKKKRWLLSALVMAVMLNDCGSIMALATEYDAAAKSTVSENDAFAAKNQALKNEEAVDVISENDTADGTSVSGNNTDTTDTADGEVSVEFPDNALSEAENDKESTENTPDNAQDDTDHTQKDACSENAASGNIDSENAGTDQAASPAPSVSENNAPADSSSPSVNNDTPLPKTEPHLKLTLYKGTETTDANILDEKTPITLSPGDAQQITAKTVPETTPADILWESSDDGVAIVKTGADGTAAITAVAEGYARITASCRDITGMTDTMGTADITDVTVGFTVDVVPDKTNPDNDKLLDLSGDIRVAGFKKESDDFVYSGQKITQKLRVYHKNKLLKEKTDYTLTYKNNVGAAEWNTVKAPSVTISLKGQYQGSVTFYYTIKPLDINSIAPDSQDQTTGPSKTPGYEQTVMYRKKLNIPAPVLTFDGKKLAVKKDFVCDYATPGEGFAPLPSDYKNGDLYEPGKAYSYTVNGTGNFTGSFPMTFAVLKDKGLNFSAASITLDKPRYEYRGTPLSKDDVKIQALKIGSLSLEPFYYDYKVCTDGVRNASLTVFPTEAGKAAGYRGCKKTALKLVGDRPVKNTVFGENWKESIPFSQKAVDKNGGIFQSKTALLAFENAGQREPLVEGRDYTIKYSNAKKTGSVTVTFKGIGRYTGSVSKKYTITPNAESKNLQIVWGKNVIKEGNSLKVRYQKNGASPEFYIKDQDNVILNSKTDYTVTVKNNKQPGGHMTCRIKGKGNYAGYEKITELTVINADISHSLLSIPDKPHDADPDKWKAAVTITDTNGKKLKAGTDYSNDIAYTYPDMDKTQIPTVGTTVTVKVTGCGLYEGTLTGTYRIYDKTKDIRKLTVAIDPQTYTGEEIKLKKSDVHIYAGTADKKAKKELPDKDSCFEIIESTYKNNSKAGTAKITLHGIGEYGGTKTCSFTILKKQYKIAQVKEIALDKTNLDLSLMAKESERTLTAAIMLETPEQVAKTPTIIWSSSDSNVATVEPVAANTENSPQAPLASSAIIHAKTAGKVTITAATQDGKKKANCKVTISIPVLKQAGQTIEGKAGDTCQLTFVGYEDQALDTENIIFESDNPNIVSVDGKGLLTMHKIGISTVKVYVGGRENVQQCYVAIKETTADPEKDSRALVYHQKEGCTDDTPYINRMLRDWEWGDRSQYDYMYLPEGVYHIDATSGGEDVLGNYKFGGIVLTEDQSLIMSPGAKLVVLTNDKSNYQVINVFGRSNVMISGGQIIGERDSHIGGSGEWGHGIAIYGCTNVYINNIEISNCWGDGIYLGFYDGPNTCSSGVTITDCSLHHNRRNNLSITDASNVTVRNCRFNYANGTAPQYGIDIEPNNGRTCRSVTISDSSFQGNAAGTIQILGQNNAHVKGVTIENCTGDKAPVTWQGFGGSVNGVVQMNNKW